jgi:type II secretory pathway pseudopilin PulG
MTQDKLLTLAPRANERTANGQRPTTNRPGSSERGYILLMLMLFLTLMVIAAGAVAPSIAFRVRRDREEEMIHRGTQYSRAIRRYVKKTGRYPSRLEDLENTNNIRFLRKRYKDPITGKDFKLLHVGEVQLTSAPSIAGATPVGSIAAPPGGAALAAAGSSMLGGAAAQAATGTTAATAPKTGTDAADAAGEAAPDTSSSSPASPDSSTSDSSQPGGGIGSSQLTSKVFGGGPIVGVASTSKALSIREFNHKNHYNQWQFIYDPSMDRGGLITTPAQPALQSAVPLQPQNSSGVNSSSPNSSGTPGSFGGMQSTPPAQSTPQPQQQ